MRLSQIRGSLVFRIYFSSIMWYLSRKDRNKFERILEKRLAIYPDAMTVKRVVDII